MQISKLKLAMVTVAAAALIGAPTSAQAVSLSIGDAYYLGYINDGIPSSPADEVNYINSLLQLSAGAAAVDCQFDTSEKCDRVNSTLAVAGLPTAVVLDGVKNETGSFTNINVTGWSYLLGKYDGPNFGSVVWYVGDLDGLIDIPAGAGANKKGEPYDLSHFSLYNFSDDPGPDPDPVPEPATLLLIGLGLLGAGAVRRRVQQ